MIFRADEKFRGRDQFSDQSWSIQICDETGLPIASALVPPLSVSRIISQSGSEFIMPEGDDSISHSTKFYRCSNYSIIEEDHKTIIAFY
jgi:hypothetical protein